MAYSKRTTKSTLIVERIRIKKITTITLDNHHEKQGVLDTHHSISYLCSSVYRFVMRASQLGIYVFLTLYIYEVIIMLT